MDDDSRVIDKGWDALPEYASKSGDADDAVTVSISTTPGEWLVNTVDSVVVPMSMHELVEALQSHKLTDRSLVWRAGMPEWTSVDRVPQLKLAARLPMHVASVPPRPTPAAGAAPSKPPPNPPRATPLPPPAPTAHAPPSRRSTLPFGPTAPVGPGSRPSHSRPSHSRPSQPRLAAPSTASKEEPEVLAVYARPAATISFDLSPVAPVRAVPSAPPAPQTLAPTTTDSPQQRTLRPTNADLSVVAASDFRQVQRSSKRLVVVSSLASAAAASLLTFALSRGGASRPTSAAAHGEALPAAAAVMAPPAPATTASAPSAAPAADATLAPTPSSEATAAVPAVKPKSKPRPVRRAKAVTAVAVPRPARTETDDATRDPSSEPNPYSVKLDEDAPAAKPTPAVHGSGLEPDTTPDASTSSSASPGF